MNFTAGEDVPAEFGPMMAEIVRGDLREKHLQRVPDELSTAITALVIGAGVAGMLISTQLAEAGIEHTVLEKNDEVGGSWYENHYPGAGVDTPSYLYSISSFDHDWSTHFGKRDEVQGYLQAFADHHRVRDRIRFGTEVVSAAYDPATQHWNVHVRDRDGREHALTSRILISAVGILNRLKLPDLPGMDTFTGPLFPLGRVAGAPRRTRGAHRQARGHRRVGGRRPADRAGHRRRGRLAASSSARPSGSPPTTTTSPPSATGCTG